MTSRTAVSLTTGMEDPEKVTVAMLVAVGAAEAGRETVMFLTKEAVRLALAGYPVGVACDGCPPLPSLMQRYADAGGKFLVCPICFTARQLEAASVSGNAALGGTVQLWEWIGDDPVVTFSY
ncbi:DsrE/DsrF-like family protein [Nakamurella panacisegetis]|uniref:DsrE/DsrF-like family protein n=1 Tax=Nakamurella panacisegetis TaxID=1090615 RepID=A0A1H0QPI1_9ACTN|nr:DsrE family protein [Nakamurella panacisegetis]SDP19257.1 DsrE/DsrF-like family protein [Nakamurella panacisegetis]